MTLCDDFEKRGFKAVADMVKNSRPPNFANWRWGTLELCTSKINMFWASFRGRFQRTPFLKQREKTQLNLVAEAAMDISWSKGLTFIAWYCHWITELQSWACGCPCHKEECSVNPYFECPNSLKGCRMHQAYVHACAHLAAGLADANMWTPEKFLGDAEFLRDAQGCVRGSFMMGRMRLAYLDQVPYLASRLDEPGVRDRCLAQYEAVDEGSHLPLTLLLFKPGEPLRQ